MGDIKPLGSEKLQGDEKLKRILELTYFDQPKKTKSTNKAEIVKESINGGLYGIVKEKDGYYVKQGLNENSLDYIGGLFMKNKNKFSSYAEALKRMNLLSGQSNLQEATKYILKPKSQKQEQENPTPSSEPIPAPAPAPEPSTEPMPDMSDDTATPEDGDNSKRSDYMSEVQKYAGKLGQELRDQHQRMESDDIKYVLNMIISAVDLDKLDLEDLEDIGNKFNREEDETSEEPTNDDDVPAEETPDTETPENDLGERMSKLDEFIKMDAPSQENEISLEKYTDIDEENDDLKEIDLDEIKNDINQRIGETLKKYFNK